VTELLLNSIFFMNFIHVYPLQSLNCCSFNFDLKIKLKEKLSREKHRKRKDYYDGIFILK
jgi:hypothetical protein